MEFIATLSLLALGIATYFLPLFIAYFRKHPSALAISALNFLAGWTIIGWLAAFIWALTNPPAPLSSQSIRTHELYKLAELREKGALTEDEFQREKSRLLS